MRDHRRHPPRLFALAIAAALLGAACGGDGGADTASTPAAETTSPTVDLGITTTEPTPDTGPTTTIKKPVAAPTTTIAGVDPTMPLTGLPITDIFAAGRPAVVVKVDNHPLARPQSGMNSADIIFEENVESLTRFALVFHTNAPDHVGPVRSGRTQDIDLAGSFNRPMFIWSGGNGRVTAAINGSDLRAISERAGTPFVRTSAPKPHNLYVNVAEVYAIAPFEASAPPQQFQYRGANDDVVGPEVEGVKVSMDGVKVLWQWDAEQGKFLRFQDGKQHIDAVDDSQVSTENVVVLSVVYRPSPADKRSPEAQTVGFGEAWVYSGGSVVKGAWVREDRLHPFSLLDPDGQPILLTPGRTFVELARSGDVATVDAGVDVDDVPFP